MGRCGQCHTEGEKAFTQRLPVLDEVFKSLSHWATALEGPSGTLQEELQKMSVS